MSFLLIQYSKLLLLAYRIPITEWTDVALFPHIIFLYEPATSELLLRNVRHQYRNRHICPLAARVPLCPACHRQRLNLSVPECTEHFFVFFFQINIVRNYYPDPVSNTFSGFKSKRRQLKKILTFCKKCSLWHLV